MVVKYTSESGEILEFAFKLEVVAMNELGQYIMGTDGGEAWC